MTRNSDSLFENYTPKSKQPSKKVRRSVKEAFDAKALKFVCETDDFSGYAQRVDLPDGKNGRKRFYYYQDNGSDVLGIAHLDSVCDNGTCTVVDTAGGLLALSGALDDRLGAYVILEMLPKLGITCDWLLTTDEEINASTADEFEPEKEYNWMFQFDRGGTDVVLYEYETFEMRALVQDAGARVGIGSFSDICLLNHLGCVGFNWGVGYEEYHGERSHAWLEDTFRMVARFVKFYTTNAATVLPYEAYQPTKNYYAPPADPDTKTDEEWWSDLVVAECGHHVDLGDATSFIEFDGGSVIVCRKCGTAEVELTA